MKTAPKSSEIFCHQRKVLPDRAAAVILFWLPLDSVDLRIVN
jgi:hypothetical protein